jgi:iron-sulfur cluster assembly protein
LRQKRRNDARRVRHPAMRAATRRRETRQTRQTRQDPSRPAKPGLASETPFRRAFPDDKRRLGTSLAKDMRRSTPQEVIMSITLTTAAATRVRNFLDKRGKGIGLRLGVRTSGCSGMAYKIEFADAADADDIQFESNGVKVLIDPLSYPYLNGTELDFVREGLKEGFKFQNPNAADTCGCGESFKV